MELWSGNLPSFVRAASSRSIVPGMIGRFYECLREQPHPAEVRSWENSLSAMAEVARDRSKDVGVIVEYHLPLTMKRIDVMFLGHDISGHANSIIVELKQWSKVTVEDQFARNVLVDGDEHLHPCEQALGYSEYLYDYHDSYQNHEITTRPCAFLHNLKEPSVLSDTRFDSLLLQSPLFTAKDEQKLADYLDEHVGSGNGIKLMEKVCGGRFKPSKKVLECLDQVLESNEQWHLLDNQRKAYNTILADIRRFGVQKKRSAVLVRGGPGTGKTVIATQMLADALRLGFTAAHSTGGMFTTILRSKFARADKLFIGNRSLRTAKPLDLDILLVDEAHRIRETSDMAQWTPKDERGKKNQIDELLDSAKVSVFLLDEHQFIRPDEIGRSQLIREATKRLGITLKEYDLATQFRCGGCTEYISWIDDLLGFGDGKSPNWNGLYKFDIAKVPEDLDAFVTDAEKARETVRLVAGFCWKWSNSLADGSLVNDVVIGSWQRPWNRKRDKKQYTPKTDPYTLWAETREGQDQVGCIYSAQGVEFDRVGVIWGNDLLWRNGAWVSPKENTYDKPLKLKSTSDDLRQELVRNAYRVLLTRGIKGTRLFCVDAETRDHIASELSKLSNPVYK